MSELDDLLALMPFAGRSAIELAGAPPGWSPAGSAWRPVALHYRRFAARRRGDGLRRQPGRGLRLPEPTAGADVDVESKTSFFRGFGEGRSTREPAAARRADDIVVQTDVPTTPTSASPRSPRPRR